MAYRGEMMNIERLADGLSVIGYGLIGIFAVIGIIALLVVLMNKIFEERK